MENNNITNKMIPAFQKAEGGLFSSVEKADVGDAVVKMREQGIELMSWADPYFPADSWLHSPQRSKTQLPALRPLPGSLPAVPPGSEGAMR